MTAQIIRIQPATNNPDYVVAFTSSFRDKEGIIHPGKCQPFLKEEAEALDIKVGDKISISEA